MTEELKTVDVSWVYTGFRDANGRKAHRFVLPNNFDDSCLFKCTGWGPFVIGGNYTAKSCNGGESIAGEPSWDGGRIDDHAQIAIWEAQSQATTGAFELKRRAKKYQKDGPLKEALEPIRLAMANASGPERAALLSWVVRYLS